ncbi:hypothetical protein NUU61_001571 [Penicillium alfredii]|uniref:Uncharacterized protein n=1 Tax=Penicillium alfredii TaxID=1506179 RepID=A0A9W9KN86_9EURO|nr:uncharacterized protein NUU61_001302 [Penicillium alfredii]XP_056515212.1 uncharacterized protein NUU61_001363 [Penicillium alfredii]XP_056515420.1 uncharacterized protein NUU61_001571 [Penicillium alfredii]KAJ5111672.1 hypothetical protein NUU61_001302 [Penicillium alfredii]KAJ5111733.1 hypothetical protein NUU61_001363 [Penicillium alfredii]KAJ5111941.1 hypothetical protein NUU61_001571 [Penicillium alfredii]
MDAQTNPDQWLAHEHNTIYSLLYRDWDDREEIERETAQIEEFERWRVEFNEALGRVEEESIPERPRPPPGAIPLTNGHNDAVSAMVIDHQDFLPEYPPTHEFGYAIVINLSGEHEETLKDRDRIIKRMTEVQYSYSMQGSIIQCFNSFLNCQTEKRRFHCTGVRACEYLDPELRNMYHNHVSESTWRAIQRKRIHLQRVETVTKKQRAALAMYFASLGRFEKRNCCGTSFNDTCALIFGYHKEMTIPGVFIPFIACRNSTPSSDTPSSNEHFFYNLQQRMNDMDTEHLRDIIQGSSERSFEMCAEIEQRKGRKNRCRVPHPQAQGNFEVLPCKVQFCTYIPLDLVRTPYIIWYSRGEEHTHPPPPPDKAPQTILDDVLALIKRMQAPEMTLSSFLKSPALKEFCAEFETETLSGVHASFVKYDRFSALIAKQRALDFPQGRDLNGVLFQYNHHEHFKEYVRKIYQDERYGNIIICGFDPQIRFMATLPSYEVDMSYKRVRGPFNEVTFATFVDRIGQGKIITLLRVLTDRKEDAHTYEAIFTYAYELVGEVTGRPAQFYYLHNTGLKAIVFDMDWAQFKGFGLFLQKQDPRKRPWDWQCRNIVMFCHVHFLRTVSRLVPANHGQIFQSSRTRLNAILSAKSEAEYYEIIDLIIEHEEDEKFKDWATHKAHPVIAAGLNKACSLIDPEFYDTFRNSTNAVEQTHWKSYFTGIYTSLLGAIRGDLDQHDVDQMSALETFGTSISWRDSSQIGRFLNHLARDHANRQKRRREAYEDTLQSEDSIDEGILQEADSSGHIRPRSRSRGRGQSRSQSRSVTPRRSQSRARASSTPDSGGLRRTAAANSYAESQREEISVSAREQRFQAETAKIEADNRERQLRLEREEIQLQLERAEMQIRLRQLQEQN